MHNYFFVANDLTLSVAQELDFMKKNCTKNLEIIQHKLTKLV